MKNRKNITISSLLLAITLASNSVSLANSNENQTTTKIKIEYESDFIDPNKTTDKIDEVLSYSTQLTTTPPTTESLDEIIEDNRKLVALTFDDGPNKYTEELVKFLNDEGIEATFFVLKYNCEKYPSTLPLLESYGHEIAIHGDTHTSFTKLTTDEVNTEIISTINYIEDLDVDVTEIVRPPYGSLNSDIKENVPYPFILWNIDTEDWKTKNKEEIKKQILDNIEAGSIILMHDTQAVHNVDLEVLKEIIPELKDEYKFVTISELAEYYNIELENGKVYRKIKSEN